ncbi:hypothetical protein [Sphingopyxis sp. GW247-27LB]|uniref:hypothetical protein n=1 Tax=Sphingopyxis sp. GW247-27LB TaxID=2012632 RepID=UPI001140D7C3|nr:hypothetical protein [Sphingopyxis sp. GW247-27LB]
MLTTSLLCALTLSGCSSSTDFNPTDAEIAKLEKRLDRHRCVGKLENWRRTYVRLPIFTQEEVAAAKREKRLERVENFDKRFVEFKLERADGRSIVAGRVKPKSYDDLPAGGCVEPNCLGGGFAIPRDELYLDCEKRAAP